VAAALIHHSYALGGPYCVFPATVQDHVAPRPFASRDVVLLARRAAEIIPRGATVAALQPSLAPNYHETHWMTAFGMMPRHRVVAPERLPQYVLAVREPFNDRRYKLITQLPEGRIYQLTP